MLLDLGSRRVISWALQPTLYRDLVLAALHQALTQRPPATGLLHLSDGGSQYACSEYRDLLANAASP